jgi:hypothetical protein
MRLAVALAVLALATGCHSLEGGGDELAAQGGFAASGVASDQARMRAPDMSGGARAQRIAIQRADLTIEVDDVAAAAKEAAALAEQQGGFSENTTISDEKSGWLQLRVPAASLAASLDALARLGKEKSRSVSSEDVTELYLDLETRLENARELRDRLRALLAQGKEVKDLVAIETELNRVQTEIESMDGQLTRLKGQVDLATISVRLERKRILGPLGYVVKGIAWAVGKLFVIR